MSLSRMGSGRASGSKNDNFHIVIYLGTFVYNYYVKVLTIFGGRKSRERTLLPTTISLVSGWKHPSILRNAYSMKRRAKQLDRE